MPSVAASAARRQISQNPMSSLAVETARAASDFALVDMEANVALGAIGMERYLRAIEHHQKLGLAGLNCCCQANRKAQEVPTAPDRDAQFTHVNATVKAAIAVGEPPISGRLSSPR
jgi:hypothetical protein